MINMVKPEWKIKIRKNSRYSTTLGVDVAGCEAMDYEVGPCGQANAARIDIGTGRVMRLSKHIGFAHRIPARNRRLAFAIAIARCRADTRRRFRR